MGDYVVHIDHGIGIFDGLKSIVNNKIKKEVLKIKYKNDDIIYLNINSLHKLSKYSSSEGDNSQTQSNRFKKLVD